MAVGAGAGPSRPRVAGRLRMPIVDVELVPGENEPALRAGLARELADSLGELFATGPGRTWVRLRILPRGDYAENGGELPPALRPVFVTLLRAVLPEPAEFRREVRGIAERVAAITGRPVEQVHVLVLPPARGRIAFGGVLREE